MKTRLLQALTLAAGLVAPGVWAAPTIVCSGGQMLECSSSNGSMATIEATVQDTGTNGNNLLVVWAVNGIVAQTNVVDAASASNGVTLSLTREFEFGTNDVTVGVTDDGTNIVMCSAMVVVVDAIPPVIDRLQATPTVLWPPNHKLVPIRLVVRTHDDCGGATWKISGVTSNEAEDALGSGHTSPDWVILDDHHLKLRAERSGRGNGRIYTITIAATDSSGNSTNADFHVFVPHDRGHRHWIEDDDDDQGQDQNGHGKGKGHGHN